MNKLVEISNLGIGYGNKVVVKAIHASLESGNFYLLIGSNGKGKSTLIKTLLTSIPVLNGEIKLNNRNLREYATPEIARHISVVLTKKNFAPQLRVYDIVSFGRIPYLGWQSKLSKQDEEIIEKYLNSLELTELKNNFFEELSDGQQQRVLIARALVQQTPVLILDEPTVFLDVENKYKLFALLQQIAKEENKAVLCSTHELSIGLNYADYIWLMDKNSNFFEREQKACSEKELLEEMFEKEF